MNAIRGGEGSPKCVVKHQGTPVGPSGRKVTGMQVYEGDTTSAASGLPSGIALTTTLTNWGILLSLMPCKTIYIGVEVFLLRLTGATLPPVVAPASLFLAYSKSRSLFTGWWHPQRRLAWAIR